MNPGMVAQFSKSSFRTQRELHQLFKELEGGTMYIEGHDLVEDYLIPEVRDFIAAGKSFTAWNITEAVKAKTPLRFAHEVAKAAVHGYMQDREGYTKTLQAFPNGNAWVYAPAKAQPKLTTYTRGDRPPSSFIKQLRYNRAQGYLVVDLQDGRSYDYPGVPEDEFFDFFEADSWGQHYNQFIR